MADSTVFEEPNGNPALRWAFTALALALLLALIWYLYTGLNGVHGVKVKDEPPVTISPMLPPPPPPPPPPPKPEEKPPEPVDKPAPAPTPSPSPKPDAPAPMQMNADAQAGEGPIASGSGNGGGSPGGEGTCLKPPCGVGGGGGAMDGMYGRYLASLLQQRVQRDNKVNRSVFSADFAIWITDGRVTRAEVVRSSGDARRDAALKSIIEETSGLNAPPASLQFPQRITVRGRKSI
jgi:outer membrane biosynthesis protein TonB